MRPVTCIALIDSGKGLLPTARWLSVLRPGTRLLLCSDPAGSPWGERADEDVIARVQRLCTRAVEHGAQEIVLACNTASVTALPRIRERWEPGIPVVGTVPAVKPAAETGAPFAVWATHITARSEYLRGLLDAFSAGGRATVVGSGDLADAIQDGDDRRIDAAIADAATRTPPEARGVVLGCTHYPLVADRIARALPDMRLYDSSAAVARQALHRLGIEVPDGGEDPRAAVGADRREPIPGSEQITLD